MKWDGINRRRFLRTKFPYTVHIYSPTGEPISTYTEDISIGGIRVVIKNKLNIHENLVLKIYLSEIPLECKGAVVWIKEKTNLMLNEVFFNIGIEFRGISKEEKEKIESCLPPQK